MLDEPVDRRAFLRAFLQEHAAHLQAIIRTYVLRGGVAYGDAAQTVAQEIFQDAVLEEPESQNVFTPAQLLPGIHTLIEHWDGQQWSIVPSPDGKTGANALNELQSVAAVSAQNVWAVGYTGLSQNQDGGTTVGSQSALVEHWDGHAWSVVQLPASFHASLLSKVVASPNGDVWALGAFESGSTGQQMLFTGMAGSGVALPVSIRTSSRSGLVSSPQTSPGSWARRTLNITTNCSSKWLLNAGMAQTGRTRQSPIRLCSPTRKIQIIPRI